MKRVHVKISGRVQGVFFRAETQRTALHLGISGWVKNVEDGSVEAVFEGQMEQVALMLAWCRKGSLGAKVTHVQKDWETVTGNYTTFDIRI